MYAPCDFAQLVNIFQLVVVVGIGGGGDFDEDGAVCLSVLSSRWSWWWSWWWVLRIVHCMKEPKGNVC